MRRHQYERKDPAFIADVLQRAEEMYLAFATEAAPYIVPLNYVFTQEKIYFHCATEGRKMDCLRHNAQVGFSTAVDVQVLPEIASTLFKSVIGTGSLRVVEDEQEKIMALDALAQRYAAQCQSPTPPAMLARTAVLCLDIESVCGKEKVGKVAD